MNIFLVGEHYSENLGDALISICFQRYLDSSGISFCLLDLSCKEQTNFKTEDSSKTEINDINFYKTNKLYRFLREIKNAVKLWNIFRKKIGEIEDQFILVYDGGSLFMDYFAVKQCVINQCAKRKHIDVYYVGCGMGKISNRKSKMFLKKAVNSENVKAVYLRDGISRFYDMFKHEAKQTYDIALLSSIFFPFEKNSEKSIEIGIGYIYLSKEYNEQLNQTLLSFIMRCENEGKNWELFTNGAPEDYQHALEFYEFLQHNYSIKYGSISVRPVIVEDLLACINKYNRLITARLHSAIISYSYGIPAFCLKWSEKIADFYKLIGHEEMLLEADFDSNYCYDKLISFDYVNDDYYHRKNMQEVIIRNINTVISSENEG